MGSLAESPFCAYYARMQFLLRRFVADLRALPWRVGASVIAINWVPDLVRVAILRAFGAGVHWHASVGPGCWFRSPKVSIGVNSTLNYGCVFDNAKQSVSIGDRCGIALGVHFLTGDHDSSDSSVRAGASRYAPIVVRNGVWIATGAVICPGVEIGDGCVIAAGAVVRSDCAPHGLYAGVPAKRIRDLPNS